MRPTLPSDEGPSRPLPHRLVVLAALPALVVFVVHAWPLRSWIIDDAGVSFAYARNLAMGHGLVSQPGVPPVEGFSNPLWTLLLAATMRLGMFHPLWTPKILSGALVGVALTVMAADLMRRGRVGRTWPVFVATGLVALSTSFVVWTTSGLENALLAALAATSCLVCGWTLDDARRSPWLAGAVAALLALTRPDAVVYAGAFPSLLLLTGGLRPERIGRTLRRLGLFFGGFLPIAGGYYLFRRAYFGQWVPNTFVAKDKPSLAFLIDRDKWFQLFDAALGPGGLVAAAAIVVTAIVLVRRRRRDTRALALGVHLALATTSYMLMPLDWMGEFRFASTFFLFFAWALGLLIATWQASPRRWVRTTATGLGGAALIVSLAVHAPRTSEFARDPITPFSHVVAFYGDGFNQLADALPNPQGSILAPDVGGTLFSSRLRVYDLVGLCDTTTARTLTTDTPAFQHYVLDQIQPTFIHVHEVWADWAVFHRNPRFLQDYVPIAEVWGPADAARTTPREPAWGDYVRRDALGPDPEATLARLRAIYRAAGLDHITL
jgi:hypothetical protein